MKKRYIEVGKVTSTRGLDGEIKVQSWCNSPKDFLKFKEIYLSKEDRNKFLISYTKILRNGFVVLKLKSCDNLKQSKSLVNSVLYVERDTIKLNEGEHFLADIIGLKVIDSKNEGLIYGVVTDVITGNTKTNLYEIAVQNGKKCLIPAVKEIIVKVDPEKGFLKINLIDGLLNNLY